MGERQSDTETVRLMVAVARLETVVGHLENGLVKFVTKDQFLPVKLIAYGIASGALVAVLLAVVSKVIH